jgi:hypothetical protein
MNVTRENHTVVQISELHTGGLGVVGLLGATPDGDVETQTNRSERTDRSAWAASDGGSRATHAPAEADPKPGHDAEIIDGRATASDPTDRYCGNCSHFEYARAASGMGSILCARRRDDDGYGRLRGVDAESLVNR